MDPSALPFEAMVFVCAHQRPEGERVACANAGRAGQVILDELKAAVKKRGWEGRVRVCKSGCQDRCEQGPNAVVVTRSGAAQWRQGLTRDDVPRILQSFEIRGNP